MGLFCVNFHVRNSSADQVAEAMQSSGWDSFVALPSQNNWTSFCDAEASNQDESRIQEIGTRVSDLLGQPLIAFMVHDSDVACYWLFDKGNLVDSFNSEPDYFEESDDAAGPSGGDPSVLVKYCQKTTTVAKLSSILAKKPVFAEQTIEKLARALGIPADRAISDFHDIADGDLADPMPEIDDEDDEGEIDPNDILASNEGLLKQLASLMGQAPRNDQVDPTSQRFVQAAATGDLETLQLLLSQGVSPDCEAPAAAMQGQSPVPAMLMGSMPARSALIAAILNNQTSAVQFLLEQNANVDKVHPLYGAPIHAAVIGGNVDVLQLLIAAKANVQQPNAQGMSALQTMDQARASWTQMKELQASVQELGIKLPKMSVPMPDFAQLELGWLECEKLIREAM
jgi:Ankyrin repeats (3 copies)